MEYADVNDMLTRTNPTLENLRSSIERLESSDDVQETQDVASAGRSAIINAECLVGMFKMVNKTLADSKSALAKKQSEVKRLQAANAEQAENIKDSTKVVEQMKNEIDLYKHQLKEAQNTSIARSEELAAKSSDLKEMLAKATKLESEVKTKVSEVQQLAAQMQGLEERVRVQEQIIKNKDITMQQVSDESKSSSSKFKQKRKSSKTRTAISSTLLMRTRDCCRLKGSTMSEPQTSTVRSKSTVAANRRP